MPWTGATVAAISYPALLFTDEDAPRCFVFVLDREADIRAQRLRMYRSGAFRRFLVVDSAGQRFVGEADGTDGLNVELDRPMGMGSVVLGVVFGAITLNPMLALRFRLETDGEEPLATTKERIDRYLERNPGHYTWTTPGSLRARISRARSLGDITRRFYED